MGPPGQSSVGLWLIEPTDDEQRALVGNQTGGHPSFVFYTDDIEETYETLGDRGVEFTTEPEAGTPDDTFTSRISTGITGCSSNSTNQLCNAHPCPTFWTVVLPKGDSEWRVMG